MYYKETQDHTPDKNGNKLWRPVVVRTGKVIDARELSKLISTATTLTASEILAVLLALPEFMNIYLGEGHTIRLDGLGTFNVYGNSRGNGVVNKEDVSPSQFNTLTCHFNPEYTITATGEREIPLLENIKFTHVDRIIGKDK